MRLKDSLLILSLLLIACAPQLPGHSLLTVKATGRSSCVVSAAAKLILISSNCPPIRKTEIEYYAMLSKTAVHHYAGSELQPSLLCMLTELKCTSPADKFAPSRCCSSKPAAANTVWAFSSAVLLVLVGGFDGNVLVCRQRGLGYSMWKASQSLHFGHHRCRSDSAWGQCTLF